MSNTSNAFSSFAIPTVAEHAQLTESQRRSRFLSFLSLFSLLTVLLVFFTSDSDDYAEKSIKSPSRFNFATLRSDFDAGLDSFGGNIAGALIGSETGVKKNDLNAIAAGLGAWSESSVYVERTNSLHPSRPSSFGPHIVATPLTAYLHPITSLTTSDSYGCGPKSEHKKLNLNVTNWIALVQRGHCSFTDKVRYAQSQGAAAVLFGDSSYQEGGAGGMSGLLTPWSPEETPDIHIPSAFISRASYLSLLKTYIDEQSQVMEPTSQLLLSPSKHDLKGLLVTLAREETYTYPLFDLLLLLLFLPSLLTVLTFFTHRIRAIQLQKKERAPIDLVDKLPVFIWGDAEKSTLPPSTDLEAQQETTESTPLLPTSSFSSSFSLSSFFNFRKESNSLAKSRKLQNQNVECSICLSDFEKGERVMELPCGHLYHEMEIRDWLIQSKRLCPVCRASISSEPIPVVEGEEISPILATQPIALPVVIEEAAPVASSSSVRLDSIATARTA